MLLAGVEMIDSFLNHSVCMAAWLSVYSVGGVVRTQMLIRVPLYSLENTQLKQSPAYLNLKKRALNGIIDT